MNKAERFFYTHASLSYDPRTETAKEGHERYAAELAAAEVAFVESGAECRWVDDDASKLGYTCGVEYQDTCECAQLWLNGECIATLGGITDATAEYRRVVRAELALECIEQLRAASC